MNTITIPVLGALLDAGADALAADRNGETALTQAGYLGHDDCVALLAARGGGEARTAPASVAVETFAVTVPAGLEAGARVGLSLGGRSHTVAVPGGVRPGEVFRVTEDDCAGRGWGAKDWVTVLCSSPEYGVNGEAVMEDVFALCELHKDTLKFGTKRTPSDSVLYTINSK
jgi:ankyrin repeat protein